MSGRTPDGAYGAWVLAHRGALAAASACLALIVVVTWLVIRASGAFPGDRTMQPWLGDHPSWMTAHHVPGAIRAAASAVAGVGSPVPALALVVVLTGVCFARGGPRLAALPALASGVVFVSIAVKAITGPSPLESATAYDPTGTLPSTHTAFVAAVVGFAAWLAAAEGRSRLAGLLVLVAALTGPIRVVQGAHWPSDVVAGYALGCSWLLAVLVLGLPHVDRGRQRGHRRMARSAGPGGEDEAASLSQGVRRLGA